MKRAKKHKIKREEADASTSKSPPVKEHDLAYYIHDRVELMHQVFSVLKPKELKAMAPLCVKKIDIKDLQELCMEELLGISSKRLCAILDGADPPSDTDSSSDSSQDRMETISLDSISSDEEILAQVSSKKSKKHKPRRRSGSGEADAQRAGLTVLELLELQARARAIRAQLQRERAASADKPEAATGADSDEVEEVKSAAPEVVEISSEDEKPKVEELQAEMSSSHKEPKKPATPTTVTKKIQDLVITIPQHNPSKKIKLKRNVSYNVNIRKSPDKNSQTAIAKNDEGRTTKDVSRSTANISKPVIDKSANKAVNSAEPSASTSSSSNVTIKHSDSVSASKITSKPIDVTAGGSKDKAKKKQKKKDRKKEKDGSDHDEIMLQLSDSEKMDLLEDLEGKKYNKSSDSEDSSSDSASGDDSSACKADKESDGHNSSKIDAEDKKTGIRKAKTKKLNQKEPVREEIETVKEVAVEKDSVCDTENVPTRNVVQMDVSDKEITIHASNTMMADGVEVTVRNDLAVNEKEIKEASASQQDVEEINVKSSEDYVNATQETSEVITETVDGRNEENFKDDAQIVSNANESTVDGSNAEENSPQTEKESQIVTEIHDTEEKEETSSSEEASNTRRKVDGTDSKENAAKSDGELSDRDSSEVEACDITPVVVCISDDEEKRRKKKRKKEKKCRREKTKKSKSDFREGADQNYYTEIVEDTSNDSRYCLSTTNGRTSTDVSQDSVKDLKIINICDTNDSVIDVNDGDKDANSIISIDDVEPVSIDDDVTVFDISGESSCYEVEDLTVSNEPTTEEMEALSAKIDEIERDEHTNKATDTEDVEAISWKDRYLQSSKVRRVLSTANLFNAMRKKNLELKLKLQQSKDTIAAADYRKPDVFVEGSIEQYNNLLGSTKYVDPVKEATEDASAAAAPNRTNNNDTDKIENTDTTDSTDKIESADKADSADKQTIATEMKKDAKQLVKMYKLLIKYKDMYKRDVRKKKKKKRKSKCKGGTADSASTSCLDRNAQNIGVANIQDFSVATQGTTVNTEDKVGNILDSRHANAEVTDVTNAQDDNVANNQNASVANTQGVSVTNAQTVTGDISEVTSVANAQEFRLATNKVPSVVNDQDDNVASTLGASVVNVQGANATTEGTSGVT